MAISQNRASFAALGMLFTTVALGCENNLIDAERPHAFAIVSGVVTDGDGLVAAGAHVTLHQFRDINCDSSTGLFRAGPADGAGRFVFYPSFLFSQALEGCVLVWAVHDPSAMASDSLEIPIAFRTASPFDSAFVEVTLTRQSYAATR